MTYTLDHGRAGSLTHWARSGIKLATPWTLVGFVSIKPCWELPAVGFLSQCDTAGSPVAVFYSCSRTLIYLRIITVTFIVLLFCFLLFSYFGGIWYHTGLIEWVRKRVFVCFVCVCVCMFVCVCVCVCVDLHPQHMEVPRLGVNWSCSCWPTPQPEQHGIQVASVTYTTACSNTAGSLTHWARPRIKPISSWILVGFISGEIQRELPKCTLFNFLWKSLRRICIIGALNIW